MVEYIEFSQVGITLAVIAIACGFVKLVWDAVKAIHDWRLSLSKPTDDRIAEANGRIDDHETRIAYLEGCCEEVHGKLNADYAWQMEASEMMLLTLTAVKQLVKHEVDGNDVKGLKAEEDKIDKYLLAHQKIDQKG